MSITDFDPDVVVTPTIIAQVAELPVGDTYTKAVFIPAFKMTPEHVKDTKRRLLAGLTPVLSRVKDRKPYNKYKMHGIHSFTRDFDVVVAVVIVREANPEDDL